MNQGYLEYSTEFDHFSLRFRLFTDHLKPLAYEVEDGQRYAVLLVYDWICIENVREDEVMTLKEKCKFSPAGRSRSRRTIFSRGLSTLFPRKQQMGEPIKCFSTVKTSALL